MEFRNSMQAPCHRQHRLDGLATVNAYSRPFTLLDRPRDAYRLDLSGSMSTKADSHMLNVLSAERISWTDRYLADPPLGRKEKDSSAECKCTVPAHVCEQS